MEPITILLADDHLMMRETWSLALNTHPQFKVVAETGNGNEAVSLAAELQPDVAILDINMPGMDGIEATRLICQNSPATKILAVSMHDKVFYARQMLKNGAMGYVTKNSSQTEVFKAINDIVSDKKYICREIKGKLSEEFCDGQEEDMKSLTTREMQIINYIQRGDSSKEISLKLGIGIRTVEVHRYNILKKLKLKNSIALLNAINNMPVSGNK